MARRIGWQGFRRVKTKKPRTWFHVLQVDPKDGFGWFDEMISLDYGEVYKLKKELESDISEYDYRIVIRSSRNKWESIKNAFYR
tara:strand:+ start:385 stop:636 length:252 start_codon:yes stop_codon:yes gene_type:complete